MGGAGGYEFDLFVSYNRTKNARRWVRRHFVPRLREYLVEELGREPRIFLDKDQEVGTYWPDNLERALQRSQLLLAVWSAPYFESAWCLAEWRTFQRRERVLGIGPDDPLGLIRPVRFADGDNFPPDAQNVQQEMRFTKYNFPDKQFADSPRYLEFRTKVGRFGQQLLPCLKDPPPWCADWPSERPPPQSPAPFRRPIL